MPQPTLEDLLNRTTCLAEVAKVPAGTLALMRRRALELLQRSQWKRSQRLLFGLVALGEAHPADALMLARCYRGLGDLPRARLCEQHAVRLMNALGIAVKPEALEVLQ